MKNMDKQDRDPLDPLFDALRGEMAKLDAPHGVEKELVQAFARQFPQQRWYHKLAGRHWGLAAGLSAACVAVLLFSLPLQPPRDGVSGEGRTLAVRDDGGGLFIALDSLERIEQEPAPRVLETEVPRSSLTALGVPLTPDNAGDAVKAEMLVAADGQPLALRLSSIN
jgi:hypothetical protein